MTQNPEQPEGAVPPPYSPAPTPSPYAPPPTTPSYSAAPPYSTPPAPPTGAGTDGAWPAGTGAAGPPPYGGATYSSGPVPAPPKARKTKLRIVGGIIVAIVVVALKFGAAFGIGALWHHSQHKAQDAETAVKAALKGTDFGSYLAPGATIGTVTTTDCWSYLTSSAWSTYEIPKSSKNDDGSADVQLDPTGQSRHLDFHLVDDGGWKIDRITCS